MIKDYFKFKTWIILFFILVSGFSFSAILVAVEIFRGLELNDINVAVAEKYDPGPPATGDNVSGFAWSSNAGWISFNSSDCDNNGSIYLGTPAGCPANGTPFFDYGVNIDVATGDFSGYAWSSNVGWIYFGPDATLPVYGLTASTSAPSNPKIWAHFNGGDDNVTGWAKILSLGNDGWIKFRKDAGDGGSMYGVTINPVASTVSGYAWNGDLTIHSIGIGWISFNSNNCDNNGSIYLGTPAGCPANGTGYFDYKVKAEINSPPTANNLQAPGVTSAYLCSNPVKHAYLSWVFSDPDVGDTQGAYQIIFDEDNDPVNDTPLFDSGKCDNATAESSGGKCIIPKDGSNFLVHNSEIYTNPNYNNGGTYYWWLKVWDNKDGSSDFIPGPSFTVPAHEYPRPTSISIFPAIPSVGEAAEYDNTGAICDAGCASWSWAILPPASGIINDTDPPVPGKQIISIDTFGPQKVEVTVTDADSHACSLIKDVGVNKKLPTWKETK